MDASECQEARMFLELTRIPRPSGHMGRINDFLESFAAEHGLEHEKDPAGNIVIRRRGNGRTIVLQGHQDIVPNSSGEFDFTKHAPSPVIEDGWVRAEGTTLGADDGGGMALMLCALLAPELEGASLECLFTTDEEIGLVGASRMAPGWLEGRMMVNIDSEDADEITVGSAGSTDIRALLDIRRSHAEGTLHKVRASGLLGGHSAGMIGSGRANAIVLVSEYLRSIPGVRIASMSAGKASNVIPESCEASFLCEGDPEPELQDFAASVRRAHREDDPGIAFEISSERFEGDVWTEGFTSDVLDAILSCPNGPLAWDRFGVRTSSNIGIVAESEGRLSVTVKPRSSDMDELDGLIDRIESTFRSRGAEASHSETFPPWLEPDDSELVRTAVEIYRGVFGKEPRVVATHGGLESSTIKDKHPGMQAISIGPTVLGAHTPSERMDLSSLSAMRRYLFELVLALSS